MTCARSLALGLLGLVLAPASRDLSAQAPASPDTAAAPSAEAIASAYLDADAERLVREARARLSLMDRSIQAYETTAAERVTVGGRLIRRDRTLFGREVVARIRWERDGPVRVQILGAREVVPLFLPRPQVPNDVRSHPRGLVFDPADPYVFGDWGGGGGDDEILNPLARDGEAHYRFRSGDTRVIRLPDGREVRLAELEIVPRRNSPDLIRGVFWLDEDTHSIVQTTFRLAGEMREGAGPLGDVRANVDYVTVEYGLWDLQWWLPRIAAVHGTVRVGSMASASLRFERTYTDYRVTGRPGEAASLGPGEAPRNRVRCPIRIEIGVDVGRRDGTPETTARRDADPAPDRAADEEEPEDEEARALREARRRECERYTIVLPDDPASLMHGDALSDAPFDPGGSLLTESDLASLRDRLGESVFPVVRRPTFEIDGPFNAPGLVRYNRVEGLALGARATVDAGALEATVTGRVGLSDREPQGEIRLSPEPGWARLSVGAYHQLAAMDPTQRPFSLGSSISAFFFGQDEADYLRVSGLELAGQSPVARPRRYEWRLYAQRERPVEKQTDFSFRGFFDRDRVFPPNEPADAATQYGGAIRLYTGWGDDPLGLRVNGEVGLDGALGTFEHGRPNATLRLTFPLPPRFVGLLEASAGTLVGEAGVQHLWRLGGPATVRGYENGVSTGEAFWRARAEVATQLPAGRLILFSDAGWIGPRDAFRSDPSLLSVGVGGSLLDGLLRLDLARALEEPTGWRLAMYLDGWL